MNGYLYALGAYVGWGLFPIYWKLLAHVAPLEVLAHRIIWSVPFIIVILVLRRQGRQIKLAFKSVKQSAQLALTAFIISINWGLYIWAVTNDKVIEASLGYFLTPVFNVLFGFVLFKEEISKHRQISVVLAFLGVVCHFIALGSLPWVSLVLGISFALYGALRKTMTADALSGLYVETTLMLPFALAVLLMLVGQDKSAFLQLDLSTDVFLILAGAVTTIPLLLYVSAARLLPMSTMGIVFFITPSMQFMSGLLLYDEPLERLQWFGFGLIWLGLLMFIYAHWKAGSNRKESC